jgi:hypothetical protein
MLSSFVVMQRWLSGFAYRIEMSPLIFAGSAMLALLDNGRHCVARSEREADSRVAARVGIRTEYLRRTFSCSRLDL